MTEHEQLLTNLKYLKMNEMTNHLDETINFINKNNLSFTEGLIKLTNYEIDHKEASMIKAMV
ncbi:MAG: transposase, partial [Anaerorhabdus sp.]